MDSAHSAMDQGGSPQLRIWGSKSRSARSSRTVGMLCSVSTVAHPQPLPCVLIRISCSYERGMGPQRALRLRLYASKLGLHRK